MGFIRAISSICFWFFIILGSSPSLALAFDFPWQQKTYKNKDECFNAHPKTDRHDEFLGYVCLGLFSPGNKVTPQTKAYYTCLRNRVFDTSTRERARAEIFTCAESYPPMKKTTPLNLAKRFFPTDEELTQLRKNQQRVLPPPPIDCMIVGDMIHCL